MKRKFFIKNLLMLLIPLLIPLLILGSLTIIITEQYVKADINKSNVNLLKQTRENIELIFSELDSLYLNFSTNPQIVVRLKRIFKSNSLSLDDYSFLQTVLHFIDSPVNAKPYIHSFYVYFDNDKRQFISNTLGLTGLNGFYDTGWHDSYISHKSSTSMWVEPREIKQYEFEKKSIPVTTLYKKLYSSGMTGGDGVIVLNIFSEYVETLLDSLAISVNESILILDDNNRPFIKYHFPETFNSTAFKKINETVNESFLINVSGKSYIITQITSEKYKLKYLSIIPQKVLYQVPVKLSSVTVLLSVMSLGIGIGLTYYLTKRSYRYIQNIISIIDSAETGQDLPPLPSQIKDEYGYIISNILKTFIEQSYLRVQLSERKYRLQLMELKALQSQINPHFLFNTLKSIYWKSMGLTGTNNEVSQMIENLSEILDYSLGAPDKTITFEEEIRNTVSYIEIQKFRYKDKFDVLWEYEDTINQYRVTKLLLQPLVENCIYHGIKEKDGKSRIKIKIFLHGSQINIAVIDNGIGISREKLAEIRNKLSEEGDYSEHIGLFNTNKRLKLTYGEEHQIRVRSKSKCGTAVYLSIPAIAP